MVRKKLKVNWDEQARNHLKKIHEYISNDSAKNAQKVKTEIIAIARSLSEYLERFPLDKDKDDNDGSYRAFVKYKYRIAYKILEDRNRILRVRSEKQEPLQY